MVIFSVDELTIKLRVLNSCVPSKGLFTAAMKEKAWGILCAMQHEVAVSLLSVIGRRPLASFIVLSCMEKLLFINFPQPTNSSHIVIDELSDAEKDIVIYLFYLIGKTLVEVASTSCKDGVHHSLPMKMYLNLS